MDNNSRNYRRFLEGDESAAGEIVKELFFNLVFFVDGYVHDVHTAEDIAVEVFSDLFVFKRRFDFRTSLKTYVFMLGRSRALNWIKHRRVITAVALDEAEEVPDEREELCDRLIKDERKRALNAALSSLEPEMRTAVRLVYFEGLSYKETAKVMKKSPKQIDNLLFRAKRELRAILEDEKEQLL